MNELHLFAGGGGILGGMLLGHRPVCAVEIIESRRKKLLLRQKDGCLPWFPIWDDISTFDGKPWKGIADVVCGGFPCTDISCIKSKADGITGAKSRLWNEMARVIREVEPRYVFAENSPLLLVRGFETVLSDLASLGYNVAWGVLGGGHIGFKTRRNRIWILGKHNSFNGTGNKKFSKEQILKSTFGAQNRRVTFRMLKHHGCYPTPLLLERLMGWPNGWTDTNPVEMDRFRKWLQWPGKF